VGIVDDLLQRIQALPEEQKAKLYAVKDASAKVWFATTGPQLLAYNSQADELFYGGSAGGGKSDLLIGLTLTAHKRSLILRRTNKEASKLFDRYYEILGSRVVSTKTTSRGLREPPVTCTLSMNCRISPKVSSGLSSGGTGRLTKTSDAA
jgi:hypothetical protein